MYTHTLYIWEAHLWAIKALLTLEQFLIELKSFGLPDRKSETTTTRSHHHENDTVQARSSFHMCVPRRISHKKSIFVTLKVFTREREREQSFQWDWEILLSLPKRRRSKKTTEEGKGFKWKTFSSLTSSSSYNLTLCISSVPSILNYLYERVYVCVGYIL